MLLYSPRKNKANKIPEYSILNPEDNSDSPSPRSNGALFVSHTDEIKKIKPIGSSGKINKTVLACTQTISIKLRDPDKIKTHKIDRPITIS